VNWIADHPIAWALGCLLIAWQLSGGLLALILRRRATARAGLGPRGFELSGFFCAHGVHKLRGAPCRVCNADLGEPEPDEPDEEPDEPDEEPEAPPKSFRLFIPSVKYLRLILDLNEKWTQDAAELLACPARPMNPIFIMRLYHTAPSMNNVCLELRAFEGVGGWLQFPKAEGISRVILECEGSRILDVTPAHLVAIQNWDLASKGPGRV